VGEDYSTLETIRRTGGIVPDATWETNWANIRKLVPVATALGVRLVSFHAGFLPEQPSDPAYDKLVDRLSRIADVFGEAVIDLAFETGQEDCRTLREFLDRLNKSNVGANFDPANMILYGKGDPVESVKALAGYIKSVHVKDALPATAPGEWGKEVAVGTGAVDWPNFFAALNAGKFTGYLCIEREAGDQRIPDITTAKNFLLNTMAKVK
jgi:L-ribulose-5-phosphate 3-epimerase